VIVAYKPKRKGASPDVLNEKGLWSECLNVNGASIDCFRIKGPGQIFPLKGGLA
jgi:hypothetical protein